jgi:hypothetical protein
MLRIGKSLADHLIAEGLVRPPTTPGDEAVVFVDPTSGAPAPVDLKGTAAADIAITIQTAGGFGTDPYAGFLDRTSYTIFYRCKKGKEKDLVDLATLIDAELDDKRAWMMNDLRVELSLRLRPLQMLPTDNPDQGSIYVCEYGFLVRKEHLQD